MESCVCSFVTSTNFQILLLQCIGEKFILRHETHQHLLFRMWLEGIKYQMNKMRLKVCSLHKKSTWSTSFWPLKLNNTFALQYYLSFKWWWHSTTKPQCICCLRVHFMIRINNQWWPYEYRILLYTFLFSTYHPYETHWPQMFAKLLVC